MTPIENLQERLAALEAEFDDAPADSGSLFELPPDGDYQASVYEFDFFEGGDPKQAFLKIVLHVEHDPDYTGREAPLIYPLEHPDALNAEERSSRYRFLRADLKRLGAEPGSYKITDLVPGSKLLKGLLDTPVEIRIKTSGTINQKTGDPYRNVYLQRRLGEPGSAAAGFTPRSDIPTAAGDFAPAQGQLDDDDIPF